MSLLNLSIAIGDYDRNRPLLDGAVKIDGVDPVFMKLVPEEIFFRAFRSTDFDICELSLSSFTLKTALGQCPYVGVPAFVSRCFRHTSIFVRTDRISKPQDLKGRKVGVPEYQLTANVWARAILQDDFGVKPSDIHWIRGGIEHAARPEKIAIKLPADVRLDDAPEGMTISELLLRGEIDGFIAPRDPAVKAANIGWLFADPMAAGKDYFKRTGIFPIMHLVVIRREVAEKNPFVATSLYEALVKSRRRALALMRATGALRYMMPWMTADLDEIDEVFGGDPWPDGIEPNRKTLEALVTYLHEQHLIAKPLPIEDIFFKTHHTL
jgi:4,5-dihydroxyphthalate decarboxylase